MMNDDEEPQVLTEEMATTAIKYWRRGKK